MDTLLADSLNALRMAQPPWRADTLGVRGAPVEFHREQANVNWPSAVITHRGQGVQIPDAQAGAPEQPPSVPAT